MSQDYFITVKNSNNLCIKDFSELIEKEAYIGGSGKFEQTNDFTESKSESAYSLTKPIKGYHVIVFCEGYIAVHDGACAGFYDPNVQHKLATQLELLAGTDCEFVNGLISFNDFLGERKDIEFFYPQAKQAFEDIIKKVATHLSSDDSLKVVSFTESFRQYLENSEQNKEDEISNQYDRILNLLKKDTLEYTAFTKAVDAYQNRSWQRSYSELTDILKVVEK